MISRRILGKRGQTVFHLGSSLRRYSLVPTIRSNFQSILNTNIRSNDKSKITNNFKLKQFVRDIHCVSCGTYLQENDPEAVGYYTPPELPESEKVTLEEKMKEIVDKNIEKTLMKEMGITGVPTKKEIKQKQKKDVEIVEFQCNRCRSILNQNIYEEGNHDHVSIEEVMKSIPKRAKIVYVLSGREFPLGFKKQILEGRNIDDFLFVINKMDGYIRQSELDYDTAFNYFHQSLRAITGHKIASKQVVLTSNKTTWSTKDLYQKLSERETYYFVGGINVGKSTLISHLLLIDNSSPEQSKLLRRTISHFPAFTRQNKFYQGKGPESKYVDTPGYSHEIFKYIIPSKFKTSVEIGMEGSRKYDGRKLAPTKIRGKETRIFNGDQLYSTGGLFYLRPPKDSIFRVFNGMSGEEGKTKNFERMLQFNDDRRPNLDYKFIVNQDAARNLVRYIIPPFLGTIDILMAGIGFFTISPNGTFDPKDLYQIYAPRGVDVAIRVHIFPYIYKVKTSRNKKGKRIGHEGILQRKSIKLHYPKDQLMFSKLIEVPMDYSYEQIVKTVYPVEIPSAEEILKRGSVSNNLYWMMPDFK